MSPSPSRKRWTARPKLTALLQALRGCRLFGDLPAVDLEAVAAIAVPRCLAKGEYVFHEGDPAEGFYVIQKGVINVHRVNLAGREQVIHIFRSGDSFAEAVLATDTGYPAGARALEPCQLLLIRKAGMVALLRRSPDLALRMLASMSRRLNALVGQIEDLTLKDVETRLAHWLIKRCPDRSSPLPVSIRLEGTKRNLAAELGTVSETLSRTLARLRQSRLVTVRGRVVTVLSPAKLADLLRRNMDLSL